MSKENRYRRPRHPMPPSVQRALTQSGLLQAFESRPPYQQNDYVGWITGAKREETRRRRLKQMLEELNQGDVYMKMPWRPRMR